MERSHTPLSVWFWAAYLVASQTPGMSAVQFQRQLGLTRYETAFGILHKLRAGMVRPDQDRIGGRAKEHVEVDRRGSVEGRAAKAGASTTKRWWPPPSRFATGSRARHKASGRMAAMPVECDWPSLLTAADSLCGFVENAVMPGSLIVTDDWSGYASLRKRGFDHHAIAECGDPEVAEQFMPMVHLVFSNLKTWLNGIHHGVSAKHLQAYLNEFTFRFNRRFYPFNAFRSLLGIAAGRGPPSRPLFRRVDTRHVAGVCINRIGTVETSRQPAAKPLGADRPSLAMALNIEVSEAGAVRGVEQFSHLGEVDQDVGLRRSAPARSPFSSAMASSSAATRQPAFLRFERNSSNAARSSFFSAASRSRTSGVKGAPGSAPISPPSRPVDRECPRPCR